MKEAVIMNSKLQGRKMLNSGKECGFALVELLVVIAIIGILASAVSAGAAEVVEFTVSSRRADGAPESRLHRHINLRESLALTFAERLPQRPGFSARAVSESEAAEILATDKAFQHVSLVHASTGRRHEFLAFVHGGPEKSIRYAARAPALHQEPSINWYHFQPGDRQQIGNAVIDLLGHFAAGYPGNSLEPERPVLGLKLEPWTTAEADLPAAFDFSAPAAGAGLGGGDSQMFRLTSELSAQLLPILQAAAFAAGVYPTLEKTENSLTLRLAANVTHYHLQAVLRIGGEECSFVCRNVPLDDFYEFTRLMLLRLRQWRGRVADFTRIGIMPVAGLDSARPMLPIAMAGSGTDLTVLVQDGNSLRALSPVSGKPTWEIVTPADARRPFSFGWRQAEDGLRIFAGTGNLSELVDPVTGNRTRLPAAAEDVMSIFHGSDGYALGEMNAIRFFREQTEAWRHESAFPVSAGPVISGGRVFYASAAGEVVCLNAADGSVSWRVKTEHRLIQRLAPAAGLLLGSDSSGRLSAFRAESGMTAWELDAGDILQQEPQLENGTLLLVSGANLLLAVEPAGGQVLSRRQLPVWIRSAVIAGPENRRQVVCIDQRNTVSFLSWPGLELIESLDMPQRLSPAALECKEIPLPWGTNDPFAERKHALILGDEHGFMYFLDLE